jgi:protein O-GlcNAc transferase
MSSGKQKFKNAAATLREATQLARKGDLPLLIRFVEQAAERYPDTLGFWQLWLHACRELGDDYAAALVALECLRRQKHLPEATQWLNAVLPNLIIRNDAILAAVDKVPGRLGMEFKVLLLVYCRELPAALTLYDKVRARWGVKTELSYQRLALTLYQNEFYPEAETMYWKALESAPENTRIIRGLVENQIKLGDLMYSEKSVEAMQLAEALYARFPDSPDAWYCMAMGWRANGRPERAYPYFKRFFSVEPEHPFRSGFTFDLNYVEDLPPAEVFTLHQDWADCFARMIRVEGPPLHSHRDPGKRLRIGYVSADFCKHPVGYFAKTIITRHNPEKFEIFLYSQRDPVGGDDEISKEFRAFAGESHWRWIKNLGPARLLKQVREDQIDILVDLSGHSTENRLDLFCNRGAPVQVAWLGYPCSTGVREIDYRFSDAIVEPEGESDKYSSERIWRLPNGFHAIGFSADLPEPSPPPILQNGYLTLGSFNNAKKIGPQTIALWARIMREIPDARMLLKHFTMDNFANRESFRSLFVKAGVDPTRVRFQGTTSQREDHFAHYAKLDIALDPLGYNGTTTTCEALYMGVPVLTRSGNTHASRVSASLLHRMGMDAWAAADDQTFVNIAKAAARRPQALAARRAGMRAAFAASPLGNGAVIAGDIETAYREMWRAKCAER